MTRKCRDLKIAGVRKSRHHASPTEAAKRWFSKFVLTGVPVARKQVFDKRNSGKDQHDKNQQAEKRHDPHHGTIHH
jgi:hypothetical protein